MTATRSLLGQPILVLNKSWMPISITPVRKALKSVCSGRASFLCDTTYAVHDFASWSDLITTGGERVMTHAGNDFRLPEIIVLTHFDKVPSRKVKLTRRNLLIRDKFTCQYTGRRIYLQPPKGKNGLEATIDHIVPQSKGGKTTWDNVVMASLEANAKKGDKSVEKAGIKLLRPPKEPSWSPIYSRVAKVAMTSKVPESWGQFLKIDPDIYWDIELVE